MFVYDTRTSAEGKNRLYVAPLVLVSFTKANGVHSSSCDFCDFLLGLGRSVCLFTEAVRQSVRPFSGKFSKGYII